MYFQVKISAWFAIKLIEYTCLRYECMLAQPSHLAVQDHHSSMHSAMSFTPALIPVAHSPNDDIVMIMSSGAYQGSIQKIMESAPFQEVLQKNVESAKKQIEDAAIEKFIGSAAFHEQVESSVQRVLKKQRVDNLHSKANQIVEEFMNIDPYGEDQMLKPKIKQLCQMRTCQVLSQRIRDMKACLKHDVIEQPSTEPSTQSACMRSTD